MINLTDPESTVTPTAKDGFIQGFNAQVAVATEGGLIVAAEVVRATSDIRQLQPMVQQCVDNGCKPQRVLVDTGYENIRQIRSSAQLWGKDALSTGTHCQCQRRSAGRSAAPQNEQTHAAADARPA